MFIDGHKVERDYEFETDVCIIGGGPTGITLACEFAKKDFKVVLLESGGKKFRHPSQWLNIAYNVGRTYFDIVFSRHRMLAMNPVAKAVLPVSRGPESSIACGSLPSWRRSENSASTASSHG